MDVPSELGGGMSGVDDFIEGMYRMLTAASRKDSIEFIVNLVRFAYPYPMHSHDSLLLSIAVAPSEVANSAKKGIKQ